ncbi:MAG: AmmeMemoRadiSam system protein A [Deltaproteobacteria bacterium]|nr:AmmeMemoRadiSam system protein A [Deltaproteobacteria bacterium]
MALARTSIAEEFGGSPNQPLSSDLKDLSGPCFVTLMARNDRLRGCIGTMESDEPLVSNVRQYAKRAAFEDPRFKPLQRGELENLSIGISALGPLKPLPSFEAIEVGRHGLHVKSDSRRGVLLAKVAVEFGWSRDQFIEHTCVKAHLDPKRFRDYQWSYFEEESFEELGD